MAAPRHLLSLNTNTTETRNLNVSNTTTTTPVIEEIETPVVVAAAAAATIEGIGGMDASYFSKCPRFAAAIHSIQKSSRPSAIDRIPVLFDCEHSAIELHSSGFTSIYEFDHSKIERVSHAIDITLSYLCNKSNEERHIKDIYRYAMDYVNFKQFSDFFYELLPQHFVKVYTAHLCFFRDDKDNSLPHSHVIMDKIIGQSLYEYITNPRNTQKEKHACIVQAIYILILVANHGFIHNDPATRNFIVVPNDKPFSMKGAFLHIDSIDKPIEFSFSAGTPRVVLIDYGDSMRLSATQLVPIEAQYLTRQAQRYLSVDLRSTIHMFTDMGSLFKLPSEPPTPETIHPIHALPIHNQHPLMTILHTLYSTEAGGAGAAAAVGGKNRKRSRRHRHNNRKKTFKKRNHK